MLYPSMEPNERFRVRRDAYGAGNGGVARLSRRSLLLAVLALAAGMTLAGKSQNATLGRRPAAAAESVSALAGRDAAAAAARSRSAASTSRAPSRRSPGSSTSTSP